MQSFRSGRLRQTLVPIEAAAWIGEIGEAKGRAITVGRQSPEVLRGLRESAIIQSAESSNRIEGVVLDAGRLGPLMKGRSKPRTRPEQEVRGYRDALAMIHERGDRLEIGPAMLLGLHKQCQAGSRDAGRWKKRQNEIVEMRKGKPVTVRFVPVSPARSPRAVRELCSAYRHTVQQEETPPLVAVAALLLDFLCIHPFRDGNGRVSRLLWLLALEQEGFSVGRYVSLEKLVEESRDGYYAALNSSSVGWHQGRHDLGPWLSYFLAIVRRAYRVLEDQIAAAPATKGGKSALILAAIGSFSLQFTFSDLVRACPSVSRDLIRKVLQSERRAGHICCLRPGRSAAWTTRSVGGKNA